MKNKTLTKNMPNVKWHAIPPVRGPNPQGVSYGNNKKNGEDNIMKKYIDKFHVWHLLYRGEIICFVCGFLLGVIVI